MIRKIKKLLFITVTTIIIGFTLTGCDAEATDNCVLHGNCRRRRKGSDRRGL